MAKNISYNKLWKLLIDKNMNKTDLRDKSQISIASLAKLGMNENLTTAVLLKICNALDCDISDIMEVIESEEQSHDNDTDKKNNKNNSFCFENINNRDINQITIVI